MKKAGLFLLFLLTAYVGGIYENPALMVLAVTELLLAPVMWALAGYLAGRLKLEIPAEHPAAVQGQKFKCRVKVSDGSALPVSRFVLDVEISYRSYGLRIKRKIYGSAMPGDNELWMEADAEHCGIIIFCVKEMKVCDYLALFSRRKKPDLTWEAVILPPPYMMHLTFSGSGRGQDTQVNQSLRGTGNAYDEIRRIREYRPGDMQRHIHWNQTARSGQLWVKEYEEEQKRRAVLCLDMKKSVREKGDSQKERAAAADRFYTLLSSLVRALLKITSGTVIYWYDEERSMCGAEELTEEGQLAVFFAALYRTKFPEKDRMDQIYSAVRRREGMRGGETVMVLNRDLELYAGEKLIYRFSPDTMEEELKNRRFII